MEIKNIDLRNFYVERTTAFFAQVIHRKAIEKRCT